MYNSSTSVGDVVSLFSDDIYSSAAMYNLSLCNKNDYSMTYRYREDLISEDCYGEPNMLGLVIISTGELTTELNDSLTMKSVDGFEPLTNIKVIDNTELINKSSLPVNDNAMTQKSINPDRSPNVKQYKLVNGRFTSISS